MSERSHPDPTLDLQSISQLIPRSRDGDSAAQNELLAQMQDYLNMMAKRHMDPSLQRKIGPSDIVQQSLAQVIQHFDDFRGGTAAEFRAWLKVIVVNELAKTRRAWRTQKRDLGREQALERPGFSGGVEGMPADTTRTPSSEAIAAERIENFHAVLGQLSDDYATVIRLRSIQRMSFREIADQMGRSHDSVTKLWYRAVLKFEELLRDRGFNSQG